MTHHSASPPLRANPPLQPTELDGAPRPQHPPADRVTDRAAWSDWLGVTASVGCAIHCAAMPFVIAYLPALGLSFLADESFHQWMAVGCLAIAVAAFLPGIRKHGRLAPVLIGSIGLGMISLAAFGLAGECCSACEAGSIGSTPMAAVMAPWLTPIGGLVLVGAHLLNRRFGCLCGCCPAT